MDLQNLQWKIHLAEGYAPVPHEWFRAFGTWIPDSPEVFVDVADYSHVEDGPVVFLAGHHVCYALDATGRRFGLLYDRRQPMEGSGPDKLRESLLSVLKAARRLEDDASFSKKPVFQAGNLTLIVNNRALAPNTEESFAALKPDLDSLLVRVFGAGGFASKRNPDPKQRFQLRLKSTAPVSVAEALKKLE